MIPHCEKIELLNIVRTLKLKPDFMSFPRQIQQTSIIKFLGGRVVVQSFETGLIVTIARNMTYVKYQLVHVRLPSIVVN